MHCLYCRQRIGAVRTLWDSQFCCSEHKRVYGTRSSRVLREKEDVFAYQERWVDDKVETRQSKDAGARGLLALGTLAGILVCASFFAHNDTPQHSLSFSSGENGDSKRNFFVTILGKALGSGPVLRAEDDFHLDLHAWKDFRPGADWSYEAGRVRPGRLRVWAPSEKLADYDFEFVGQIERKNLAYAFRALNPKNYYANKLTLAGAGTTSQSELIRYIVVEGKVQDRAHLPIPISLDRGTDYRIRLSVRGSEFLTSIDGRVVSTWRDRRLSRGGVGFFSEDGEASLLKWASLSERDSVIGRLLSHFSLITFPVGMAEPGFYVFSE